MIISCCVIYKSVIMKKLNIYPLLSQNVNNC